MRLRVPIERYGVRVGNMAVGLAAEEATSGGYRVGLQRHRSEG
jgi:hypothetical protein